ncbi:hypothetical protein NEMBOFW57_009459 [Staphylotrichum longicolle]|uniref:Uncharacterized protein n=1 Tax=Staphylotrichum longicolle TaxID=669026 RepID=A0AAD4EPF2_9PEZI|nr:hypothetical protein NEMBOFW57_009459 [Staphylotrichum longicolle]
MRGVYFLVMQGERREGIPTPPPYDAAEEKLHAVQEGAEPSYAAVTAGEASATTSRQPQQGKQSRCGAAGARTRAVGASSSRYVIAKQQDLYPVNEFLKFVNVTPG